MAQFHVIRQRSVSCCPCVMINWCVDAHVGRKCENDGANTSIWTLQAARGVSRKRTSREHQKATCREEQKRMRSEADAKHRGDNANKDRRFVFCYTVCLCVLC